MIDIEDVRQRNHFAIMNTATGRHLDAALTELETLRSKETVVRDGLARIESGIESIVSMMSPAQRSMVFKEVDSIFSGVTMIEGVYK